MVKIKMVIVQDTVNIFVISAGTLKNETKIRENLEIEISKS